MLAGLLALLALPWVTYQLRYPESAPLEVALRLRGYLMAVLILVVTWRSRGAAALPASHVRSAK